MKKIVALLLSLVLLCSFLPLVSAKTYGPFDSNYPVIVVPGYTSTALYRINENGEEEQVWGVDMDEIVQTLLKNIAEVGIGLGALTVGNAKKIAKVVGREFVNLYGDLACNPDGSSVYDLHQYCTTAEEANSVNLQEKYGDRRYQYETEIMDIVASYVGEEKIFNFNCDFRMSAAACAKQLDEFVQSVKTYTGAPRVNIFAVSHGGQVTGTYLTLYGEKGDVQNAVMTVPALGGAAIAYDLLARDPDFDELELMQFIEHGMMWETDYHWLLKAQQLGFLDDVLYELVPYLQQVLLYWGSIWDFIETEFYEDMKAKYLDPVESAAFIARSDRMHYEIMPQFAAGFARAQKAGANPYIVAGYNLPAITGQQAPSDAIITTKASTGATVAPFGQRFADGYTQVNETARWQVSPSMTVDASTAYMPDYTFFVEGLFHGMTFKDDYTEELCLQLLLTNARQSVTSDPKFPQFHATTNRSQSVFAAFDQSVEGYVSDADSALIVRNLSEQYPMYVKAITVRGMDVTFPKLPLRAIKPGQEVRVKIKGDIPALSRKKVQIVIDYSLSGSPTPLGERTLNFTVMNGTPALFDSETPLVDANYTSPLAKVLPKRTGLRDLMEMWINVVRQVILRVQNLAE